MIETGTWLEMVPDLPGLDQLVPRQAGPPPSATLTLGAVLTAARCGRAWTRAVLREWHQPDELAEIAEFLMSELVTNAVLASREACQPVIHLSLVLEPDRVLIFVRDYAARQPEPRHAGTDDEGGRGLTLVSELSHRFGWYPPADRTPGKVVWAAVRAETSAGMNLT
jgi:anti-sigma regulatory factor (Ser/Thr protein kinase)